MREKPSWLSICRADAKNIPRGGPPTHCLRVPRIWTPPEEGHQRAGDELYSYSKTGRAVKVIIISITGAEQGEPRKA
jgi:hypothetical protein